MLIISQLLLLLMLVLRAASESFSDEDNHVTEETRNKVVGALERNLLNMFGLPDKPSHQYKPHVPQFMMELYEERVWGEAGPILTSWPRSSHHATSDTVRSFAHLSSSMVAGLNHSVLLHFQMDDLPSKEILMGSELRLYREELNSLIHPDNTHQYRIDISQVFDSSSLIDKSSTSSNSSSSSSDHLSRLLDTKIVSPNVSAWESFDISPAVRQWAKQPLSTLTLQVNWTRLDNSSHNVGLSHFRVVKRSISELAPVDWEATRPLLVTYLRDTKRKDDSFGKSKPQLNNRVRRRAAGKKNGKKKKDRKAKRVETVCKRHFLLVNFREVGWDSWIVAPAGYYAYYCQGKCPFILTPHLNATNHAIIQNLVHEVNPNVVPKPCCVPTSLYGMSMLYYGQKGGVILKEYDDMAVEGCGCR